jgi:hypothetical protein
VFGSRLRKTSNFYVERPTLTRDERGLTELIALPREERFVRWYRWAQDALGEALVSDLKNESIVDRVSKNVILVLPLPGEETKEQTSNRPDPVIYILDKENTLQLGLECNTLKCVEKLRNILDLYHAREKSEFLELISKIDDGFETLVYAKLKPHNFAESPEYRVDWKCQSNLIAEEEIGQLFSRADAIRRSGVEWRLKDGLSHPPEVPSIDIACTQVAIEEEAFKRKIVQIRSLFEITLRVKIDSDLKRAKAAEEKKPKKITKIFCTSCKIEYTREQFQQSRFCRACNNRTSFVHVSE